MNYRVELLCPEDSRGKEAREVLAGALSDIGNHLKESVLLSYLWSRRIPSYILSRFPIALNFHPAPLPEYKGFAPYTFGILNGETSWGVSCHYMIEQIDEGPIIEVNRFPIDLPQSITAATLQEQTGPHLLTLFKKTVRRVLLGSMLEISTASQVSGRYYSRKLFEFERTRSIDEMKTEEINRYRRAFHCPPHPGFRN